MRARFRVKGRVRGRGRGRGRGRPVMYGEEAGQTGTKGSH